MVSRYKLRFKIFIEREKDFDKSVCAWLNVNSVIYLQFLLIDQ